MYRTTVHKRVPPLALPAQCHWCHRVAEGHIKGQCDRLTHGDTRYTHIHLHKCIFDCFVVSLSRAASLLPLRRLLWFCLLVLFLPPAEQPSPWPLCVFRARLSQARSTIGRERPGWCSGRSAAEQAAEPSGRGLPGGRDHGRNASVGAGATAGGSAGTGAPASHPPARPLPARPITP